MDKQTNQLEVITPEQAAKHVGMPLHTIAFSEFVDVQEVNWERFSSKLKTFDSNLTMKEDGIEMFDGEITVTAVAGNEKKVEVTWDEPRERWSVLVKNALREEFDL
ncbi:unnamed protein product [Gongylonema pulchrum]|uniref:Prophage protein n=1 Tax=Gongylonema pulchrum TaxID=637853 RepID=A0A183ELW3_9BILA|nr:unnamed protein product [Gongylonema pulchrum]